MMPLFLESTPDVLVVALVVFDCDTLTNGPLEFAYVPFSTFV